MSQVITEDSDLLAYGCPHVLFKMDKTGVGQEICTARLPEARNPSFVGFSHDMFLEVRSELLQSSNCALEVFLSILTCCHLLVIYCQWRTQAF